MQRDWKIDAAERANEAGDTARAMRLLQEVLTTDPRNARALSLKGVVHTADSEFEEARAAHALSVAAVPANAVYRTHHANSLIAAGELDAAEAELGEALKIDPDYAIALGALAWLKKASRNGAILDRLIALKGKQGLSNSDAIKLCYALGKSYDDIGEYDLAFANFREANERQDVRYYPAANDKLFADIKSVWNASFFAERKGAGFDSRKPVFVLGMPRSGTTLLEQKLADHPGFKGLGECAEIIKTAATISRNHPRQIAYPHWSAEIPLNAYAELGKLYVGKVEGRYPDAIRFIDKSLMNFAYVGMIKLMLPNSLVIDSRRNALDTCLSCYFQELKPSHNYSFDLANLGHLYRHYVGVMEHWREHVDNLVTVQYEQFVETPDEHVRNLKRRMGLREDAQGLARQNDQRHVKTWSAVQVRQPVYKTSVARWKNYEKHLSPLIDLLGDLAKT